MSPTYKLQCLKNAVHKAPDPIFLFMKNFGEQREVNCYFWLIRGNNMNILVDTGMGGDYPNPFPELARQHEKGFQVGDGEDTINQLRKFDLSPKDIDILIITHLHYDHIANIPLFNNNHTKIVVNRKGWDFAKTEKHPTLNPFPGEILKYTEEEMGEQLYFNQDEEEIVPGISVIWTGGHTLCSQAVSISTAKGIVILTGDVAYLYENIEQNHPIGLAFNLYEAIEAVQKLKRIGDILLPGHDKEIMNRYPKGLIV